MPGIRLFAAETRTISELVPLEDALIGGGFVGRFQRSPGQREATAFTPPRHQPATQEGEPYTAGDKGCVMSVLMDLLFREYLKARLAEMKVLPAKPAGH